MLIGIDALPLVPPKTGIGHYTFELAHSLAALGPADEIELISPSSLADSQTLEIDHDWPVNLSMVHMTAKTLRRRWWTIGLPLYALRSSLDVFHGTNYDVPLWARCATVNSIHDLSVLLYPETHEAERVHRARRRLPLMARAATMIITATESVKREVCEHLHVRPEKVAVTPFAPRRIFRPMPRERTLEVKRRLNVEDEFLLYVGTIEPRKNLITLVRALDEILRTTSLRPQLVIVGREGWLTGELFSFIKESGVGSQLRFTGYVSEEDLCALYSSCQMCVYPSLYEGFGLPLLEAMACGAPVITTRTASIMETVGNAARHVPPTDVQAFARTIADMLKDGDQRRHWSSIGIRHAAQFRWERTAYYTLEVYKEAMRRKVCGPTAPSGRWNGSRRCT